MTGDDLYDLAENIQSRDDFLDFLKKMIESYDNHIEDWENKNVRDFISGLSIFAEEIDGYYLNMNENVDIEKITWKMAAQILHAGRNCD